MITGTCWVCRVVFTFDPRHVCAVPLDGPMDPVYGLDGDRHAAVCRTCVFRSNVARRRRGRPTWTFNPAAYGRVIGFPQWGNG